jgi:hypothetical protein
LAQAKLASGGSTTLSVTEISRGQRGDISSMRLWLSGTLLNIAHFPNFRGINWGQVNEVVNTDQPGVTRTMYSTAIVANDEIADSCGITYSFLITTMAVAAK